MHYVFLIHAAESRFATTSTEDGEAMMQAYGVFTRELMATGRAGDCAALEPTHTATSVRVRDGRREVKDGPFAETREQLGGYYTLHAETEEEAVAWAAKIPGAAMGSIEVRTVMQTPAAPAATSTLDGTTHKQYMLLIYEPSSVRDARTEAERGAMFAKFSALNADLRATGRFIAGQPLESGRTKVVSITNEKRTVRDGPFAETREQLGGYYRVWARDLDEAIAIAARVPSAETGTIEVRPVRDTSRYM